MRRYELMLLLRPDLEDDKLQSAVEKVTRAIVNAGGSLSKVSPWGKRRLAYEINHFREASYFLIHFDIEPAEVRGIERGMLISEEILRHLVTLIEDRGPARLEETEDAAPARGEAEEGAEDGEGPLGTAAPEATAPQAAAPDETAPGAAERGDESRGEPAAADEEAGEPAEDERAEREPAEERVEA